MNSILEALRKSTEASAGEPRQTRDFLFEKSPYDSASVYWERRRLNDDKSMQRKVQVALFFGAFSTIVALVVIVYAVLGMKKPDQPNLPPPVNSVSADRSLDNSIPIQREALPPVYAPTVDDLPEPYVEEVDQPLPLDLPDQGDLQIIEPTVTPLPMDLTSAGIAPDDDPLSKIGQVREPDRPRVTEPAAAYNLQGIIWDEQNPVAMINGRSVHVGDKISGATIVEINKSSVVLEKGSERVTLR